MHTIYSNNYYIYYKHNNYTIFNISDIAINIRYITKCYICYICICI